MTAARARRHTQDPGPPLQAVTSGTSDTGLQGNEVYYEAVLVGGLDGLALDPKEVPEARLFSPGNLSDGSQEKRLTVQQQAAGYRTNPVLLYFVIYLQDVLGYSALGAGLRIAIISVAQLATAVIAGRLSERVPARWLIGPGLLLVGVGLILITGTSGASSWTHLIPGFIVAGLGAGLVNPPLASTAIGVVSPERSGMASGVNNTFRQVGIAAGIAVLGSVFTAAIGRHLPGALPPSLSGRAPTLENAVRQGSVAHALASVPAAQRAAVAGALRSSAAAGINDLMYVTAAVAIAGAACATLLIRQKDFRRRDTSTPAAPARGTAERTR